jgi:hypothetical protein
MVVQQTFQANVFRRRGAGRAPEPAIPPSTTAAGLTPTRPAFQAAPAEAQRDGKTRASLLNGSR